MDYRTFRLFLHLSRTLSFTRTARDSGVSVSSLSRAIQRLEEEVGAMLLIRDRRSVRLSREGELFREHVADALLRYEALRQRLHQASGALTGAIRVFASVTAVQSFLPRLLGSFRRAHPEVQIELATGYAQDALGMLDRGAVDVSVAALPRRVPRHLEARTVVVTPLSFVAPVADCEVSRLVERRNIPWPEVPVVLPAAGLSRSAADRWFHKRRVRPRVYGEVPGNEAILSLVSLGCGVGIVPRLVADRSPLRSEIRPIEVEPRIGDLRVGVCTERRSLRLGLVRAFWDSIDAEEG